METKTFDELKQMAIQIRDEKTNKQNTANRIGTEMLEHLDKLEQDYYDKTTTDEELKKRDDKLTELSSDLSLEMELINNSMSAASPIYFPIEGGIKSGDKLRIVFSGLSSDKDCAAFLCDSKITIASEAKQILFDGHPGNIDGIYTANVDANGIQLYSENSSNVIVYNYKITNLKKGYSKLNNEIGNINNQDKKAERPAAGYENFSVKINYADEDNLSNSTNVQAGKNFKTDYGVIALPQNYTPNGTPTRLIIFCQGTGERITDNTNPMNNFGWQYFIKKGYAVLDMNGMSTEWGEEKGFPITNQHYSNKYIIQSYTKGYNYVITKYNLYKETFVLGLSMGGSAMLMISQTGNIPILACAGFAPTISVYKNNYMKPWNGENQKRTIAGQWNFDNWESATLDQLYFISNLSKITGYDNLMINTFGDTTDIDTANNNYDNDEEKNAYYRLQKYFPHPLKIWHCDDDSTVLIRYADFFVKMINNAGGRAWLRRFPTGGIQEVGIREISQIQIMMVQI